MCHVHGRADLLDERLLGVRLLPRALRLERLRQLAPFRL